MPTATPIEIDAARVHALTRRELEALNARTAGSARMYERARASLSGGVASSYQLRDPWPIYLATGEGARVTGRETIVKIFGSYHGHHDAVMVSIGVPYEDIGDRDDLASLPYGAGIPRAVSELTVAVPFNDAEAMERRIERLEREQRKPACVIMEAAMMNLGVVLPREDYLKRVREVTRRHDVVLIFDEVKTGLAIAAGGATERFGVRPDIVTLAKTLGGGLPCGAIGGTERAMSVVEDASVYQVGTYNGNPLTMAAARASLQEVLTAPAYEHLEALNERILGGCEAVIERHRLPGYAVGIGSKGCVTFSTAPVVDYESFKASQDAALTELAWLWNMNRGIYMTPGREEEWTLSVAHTDEAVDAYVHAFEQMAAALAS
ncbi:MAG TPA: aminotransferase class III-fold pyridoxal phosphate-dependent enzyme [Solirubrobacteraceae bacterium]|nr:aminotransferase class III-fold pyridoxal phosphate-dependent enzyme [Solirubrobacteraceae bacterium]